MKKIISGIILALFLLFFYSILLVAPKEAFAADGDTNPNEINDYPGYDSRANIADAFENNPDINASLELEMLSKLDEDGYYNLGFDEKWDYIQNNLPKYPFFNLMILADHLDKCSVSYQNSKLADQGANDKLLSLLNLQQAQAIGQLVNCHIKYIPSEQEVEEIQKRVQQKKLVALLRASLTQWRKFYFHINEFCSIPTGHTNNDTKFLDFKTKSCWRNSDLDILYRDYWPDLGGRGFRDKYFDFQDIEKKRLEKIYWHSYRVEANRVAPLPDNVISAIIDGNTPGGIHGLINNDMFQLVTIMVPMEKLIAIGFKPLKPVFGAVGKKVVGGLGIFKQASEKMVINIGAKAGFKSPLRFNIKKIFARSSIDLAKRKVIVEEIPNAVNRVVDNLIENRIYGKIDVPMFEKKTQMLVENLRVVSARQIKEMGLHCTTRAAICEGKYIYVNENVFLSSSRIKMTKNIQFDIQHEVDHALSYNANSDIWDGLLYSAWDDRRPLIEGMADYNARKLTGSDFGAYIEEREMYEKILRLIKKNHPGKSLDDAAVMANAAYYADGLENLDRLTGVKNFLNDLHKGPVLKNGRGVPGLQSGDYTGVLKWLDELIMN